MRKGIKVLIWLIVLIAAIKIFDVNSDAFFEIIGRGTKIAKIGQSTQLGFTGIYVTVLDYGRIFDYKKGALPLGEMGYEPKKLFAFQVQLDGRKERTGGQFGHSLGTCGSFDCYYTSMLFYLEGKLYGKDVKIDSLPECYAIRYFNGNPSQLIGIGKLQDKVASGIVLFGVPEDFVAERFVIEFYDRSDFSALFPRARVVLILEHPIK